MKTILYIGNHLSRGGAYPSVAESLAPYLLPEVQLRLVSHYRNKPLRLAHMLWAVVRFGRKEHPVLIDTYSSLNFWYALLCGIGCRLMGIPYYCVLHGGNLPDRLKRTPQFCRWLFGGARRLISPSGYLQDAFRKAGYEAEVIPNPIPIANYPFKLRDRVRPRLLWVRAFSVIYHPQMAIRVLHELVKDYPDAELCMVGPDKDGSMGKCKAMAEALGIAERVTFTGLLPKDEWIRLSADYDIFINTTNVDNMPVSVIEAMALGLPVVCTDAGGLPYLIKDDKTGLLVSVGDVGEMVARVTQLLDDPEVSARLSVAGRKQAEEFDMEKVAQLWKKLLTEEYGEGK
ncbi:MAG: glycosyltransferase family 1 protein [Calditrichaeota bacterium]|nr:MAG: glycosyltransferase family 1 protein [Calditrichota bacterium]